MADILRFRMLMIAAGCEDGNDADSLRHDPAFKLALGRLPDGAALCSQPTISRLENLPRPRDLLRMAQAMAGLYCDSFRQVPRRITPDIDDTFDAVHCPDQALVRLALERYRTSLSETRSSIVPTKPILTTPGIAIRTLSLAQQASVP